MSDQYQPANPWWWIKQPDPWVTPFWIGYSFKGVLLVLLVIGAFMLFTQKPKQHPTPVFAPPVETPQQLDWRLKTGSDAK